MTSSRNAAVGYARQPAAHENATSGAVVDTGERQHDHRPAVVAGTTNPITDQHSR